MKTLFLLFALSVINAQFNCPSIPAGPVPDNVNKLRPSVCKLFFNFSKKKKMWDP